MQSFIELFQGNLRDFMQDSLHGSAKYLPMVQEVFRAESLPWISPTSPSWKAVTRRTPLVARPPRAACGSSCRRPGKEYGLDQNWFIDERSTPRRLPARPRST